jgi:hypothetical protein
MPWSIRRGGDGEKHLRGNQPLLTFAMRFGAAVLFFGIRVRWPKGCSTDQSCEAFREAQQVQQQKSMPSLPALKSMRAPADEVAPAEFKEFMRIFG